MILLYILYYNLSFSVCNTIVFFLTNMQHVGKIHKIIVTCIEPLILKNKKKTYNCDLKNNLIC